MARREREAGESVELWNRPVPALPGPTGREPPRENEAALDAGDGVMRDDHGNRDPKFFYSITHPAWSWIPPL